MGAGSRGQLLSLSQLCDLPGLRGHVDFAAALPVALDAVTLHVRLHLGEVLDPRLRQALEVVGPMCEGVAQAVREQRHAEAAVAA